MRRFVIAAFLTWVVGFAAIAHDAGWPGLVNVYGLDDTSTNASNATYPVFDPLGHSQIFPSSVTSIPWFVTIGQSRIANNSSSPASPYVVTNGANCINLSPYSGFYYIANDPVIGATATPGNFQAGWHGRLCDKLITASKYTQVGFIPIAMGGSAVADWISGGQYNPRITVAAEWLTALGITPKAWMWQQGTSDCVAGTSGATYQTDLQNVISFERALSGRSSDHWIIAEDTIHSGTTCSAIETAQATVGGQSGNYVGPNADAVPMADYDGTHYNNTGNDWIAGQWSTAIQSNCTSC